MSNERPSTVSLVLFAAVFVAILGWMGMLAYQSFFAPEPEQSPPFAEQVEAISAVAEVRTETDPIPGSPGGVRALSSWVTFTDELVAQPEETAQALAGVTRGFSTSTWDVQGSDSTARVNYLAPVEEAPFRWWAQAVSLLEATPAQDAIHCQITDFSLRCEADSDDPEATLKALSGADGAAIGPWLEAASVDEGEEKGFELRIDGRTFTDPTALTG